MSYDLAVWYEPGHLGHDAAEEKYLLICEGADGVGLAALAGREHSRPSRQLRWYVDDSLAVGDQPLRQVSANAVAALYRPDPLRVPLCSLSMLRYPSAVGVEPAKPRPGRLRIAVKRARVPSADCDAVR